MGVAAKTLQKWAYKNKPPKYKEIYFFLFKQTLKNNLFFLSDLNRTAAEWHAFKKLWNQLSEKMRKKLEVEHTKRLEEYEEKLQAFKKV